MTAGIIHPLSSDPYALAMAAVWKKSIDLGVPLEFLMIESMGPWSSDPLAMAAVWKKAIGLGVPIEFLMSETMALAPWSPGPRSRTSTPRAASAYQAACHAASSGLVTGGRSSCPLPGYSLIPAPQVGPTSWAVPDQTVLDHHANIKPEPLQSAPESSMEVPAAVSSRPSTAADRKRRRLESNRLAARKFRNNKRVKIDNIFVTIAKLERKNTALQRELSLIHSLRKAGPKANWATHPVDPLPRAPASVHIAEVVA